jgi:hypothetical protein
VPSCFESRPFLLLLIAGLLGACTPSGSDQDAQPPPSHLDSLAEASSSHPARETPARLARSQTLYVPAYSHIYIRDAQRSMNLATTLSIRNASPTSPIILSTVDYYDSNGNRVRGYLDTARRLPPLASTYVVVEQDDLRGGVGANFIVRWHAEEPVHLPVVETVMITTESTQGISFRSTARVLSEDRASSSAVDTLNSSP